MTTTRSEEHSGGDVEVPDRGYSIGEAARLNGVSVHTLRFYEKSGMMPSPPARTSGGSRRYHAAELEWIHTCTKLRSLGMSTALIREYVDLVRDGPGNELQRLHLLKTHRTRVLDEMARLRRDLYMIDGKIEAYERRVVEGSADHLWSTPRDA